jgi:hypothetical protein
MEKSNRTHMLIEALEYYIQDLKKNNCTEASIQAYTTLLKEIDVDNYSVID